MLISIALLIALTTFVATALHMYLQSCTKPVSLAHVAKLKPYQSFEQPSSRKIMERH